MASIEQEGSIVHLEGSLGTDKEYLYYHIDDLVLISSKKLSDVEDINQYIDCDIMVDPRVTKDLNGDYLPKKSTIGRLFNVGKFDVDYYPEKWVSIDLNENRYYHLPTGKVYLLQSDYKDDIEVEDKPEENHYTYMITGDTVTLTRNEDVTVIDSSHNNFKEVIEKILEDKFEEAFKLMDITKSISKWGKGLLKIEDGIVTYSDMEITSKLVSKIINMMNEGNESFERFAKCLNLTMENPSYKNRSRIMDFVSAGDIEIDDEGYIICYKNVNHDYKDKHTGKFSYKVGETPSMPRHLDKIVTGKQNP